MTVLPPHPDPIRAQLGELLFHYAPPDGAIDHILGGGSLRLSPFRNMNDPREAKEWAIAVVSSAASSGGIDLNDTTAQFNDSLKGKIKVACFTADRVVDEADRTALDFGWAHPRMWAHYGGNHAGIALGFRRDRLEELFRAAFDSWPALWAGDVNYCDDDPFLSRAFTIDAAQVAKRGIDGVLADHAERFHRDLFFTKLTDWATENEFRLLLQGTDDQSAYLAYENALVAVCVGQHWDGARDTELQTACGRLGITPSQVWWRNGHPELGLYDP